MSKIDRITTESDCILEALADLQYRVNLIMDTNELFQDTIKVRRKYQAVFTSIGKAMNYLSDGLYMYRTGKEIRQEDRY